jgi:hypothetical protein
MKKSLSPAWFLKDPLDLEHKEYVLLDYLKHISKDLDSENCLYVIKEISRIIKSLNSYKSNKNLILPPKKYLKKEDRVFIEGFNKKTLSEDDEDLIRSIIDNSLDVLYQYSEICLEMIKEEESKIKIFKINSKLDKTTKKENSGILIIRNMITDKILNYLFKSQIKMKTSEGDKEISILKKVPIKNSFFSLNYEYIYHEILNENSLNSGELTQIYVIEIYENFEEESDIYRMAKEKFIDSISNKNDLN